MCRKCLKIKSLQIQAYWEIRKNIQYTHTCKMVVAAEILHWILCSTTTLMYNMFLTQPPTPSVKKTTKRNNNNRNKFVLKNERACTLEWVVRYKDQTTSDLKYITTRCQCSLEPRLFRFLHSHEKIRSNFFPRLQKDLCERLGFQNSAHADYALDAWGASLMQSF